VFNDRPNADIFNTVPKFAIRQSELIRSSVYCPDISIYWSDMANGKYHLGTHDSPSHQTTLFSPGVFWLDYISPKYKTWFDQTCPVTATLISDYCIFCLSLLLTAIFLAIATNVNCILNLCLGACLQLCLRD